MTFAASSSREITSSFSSAFICSLVTIRLLVCASSCRERSPNTGCLSPDHDEAAVDRDQLAGDETCPRPGHEDHHWGEVVHDVAELASQGHGGVHGTTVL